MKRIILYIIKICEINFCLPLVFFSIFILNLEYSNAETELERLTSMWGDHEYSKVLPLLLEYGKNPEVQTLDLYYMIGTSACYDEQIDIGIKYLDAALRRVEAETDLYNIIKGQMDNCPNASRNYPSTIGNDTTSGLTGIAGVHGILKGGYLFGGEITVSSPKTVRKITAVETKKRLCPNGHPTVCINTINEITKFKFNVISGQYFIIASDGAHTQDQLKQLMQYLEMTRKFLVENFGMSAPENIVTVYMFQSSQELEYFAYYVHGISIPNRTIGYSFSSDLSIAGVVPQMQLGTLTHELFHLMVHRNFSDIPPWMDEGMAGLYEKPIFIDLSNIDTSTNWRRVLLSRYWNYRPSIGGLVKMDVTQFQDNFILRDYEYDTTISKAALNYALSKYFMLYLQDNNKLIEVYKAFRDRNIATINGDISDDNVRLIETILQRPITRVDNNFASWYQKKYSPE